MYDATRFDVLIVGAGPAGLAAAEAAVQSGARVGLVDENAVPGGQIHRASAGQPNVGVKLRMDALAAEGVRLLSNTTVFDAPSAGVLLALSPERTLRLEYTKLILAVGARELFLPFPGWTLPNVMGVGGLQALVKAGLDVGDKRIVVAGSGPLLIAVGGYLNHHGAKVILIAEQSSVGKLSRFLTALAGHRSKLTQGIGLLRGVGGLLRPGRWVERADGKDQLESVRLNKSSADIPCDYLACSFGFVPNLELPMLLGCEIQDGYVSVDPMQATSIENVLCAGEPTGIGGIDLSTVEGTIAGFAATGQEEKARSQYPIRSKAQSFARALDQAFSPREELKAMADPHTIVCRCEDVTAGHLSGWESSRAAKLHTRCGMGPCQGRVCGPATRFLFGWEHGSVRSPLVPVPLSGLEMSDQAAGDHTI